MNKPSHITARIAHLMHRTVYESKELSKQVAYIRQLAKFLVEQTPELLTNWRSFMHGRAQLTLLSKILREDLNLTKQLTPVLNDIPMAPDVIETIQALNHELGYPVHIEGTPSTMQWLDIMTVLESHYVAERYLEINRLPDVRWDSEYTLKSNSVSVIRHADRSPLKSDFNLSSLDSGSIQLGTGFTLGYLSTALSQVGCLVLAAISSAQTGSHELVTGAYLAGAGLSLLVLKGVSAVKVQYLHLVRDSILVQIWRSIPDTWAEVVNNDSIGCLYLRSIMTQCKYHFDPGQSMAHAFHLPPKDALVYLDQNMNWRSDVKPLKMAEAV